ncbi:hypothetical protein IEQ34_025146 [Dendrobium chrysotoxum]|uniref:Major facilitator superfamily (MFS) profile domain-containing protein n=1 Tax=Dendrobium chrysotoxum TaxID=161865 RepID=A0AAV7FRU7_DENCH|nr:hypothetical protein IEQ34_025146 [Dendrobium chrysotoxum]
MSTTQLFVPKLLDIQTNLDLELTFVMVHTWTASVQTHVCGQWNVPVVAACSFGCCMDVHFNHWYCRFRKQPKRSTCFSRSRLLVRCRICLNLGTSSLVVCGEIFPLAIRAKAFSLCTASNWLWNFGIGYATPYLVDSGPGKAGLATKVFFIWAGTCSAA